MARRSTGGPAPRLPAWAPIALAIAAAIAALVLQRGGSSSGRGGPERLPPGPASTPAIPPSPPATSTSTPAPPPTPAHELDLTGLAADERAAIIDVVRAIDRGGPFAYRKDGVVFTNREDRLAAHPRGHWREYTVATPGARDRGARRIVAGADGELFYTDDHYRTFLRIRGPTARHRQGGGT